MKRLLVAAVLACFPALKAYRECLNRNFALRLIRYGTAPSLRLSPKEQCLRLRVRCRPSGGQIALVGDCLVRASLIGLPGVADVSRARPRDGS
jgi:hypothetical protein